MRTISHQEATEWIAHATRCATNAPVPPSDLTCCAGNIENLPFGALYAASRRIMHWVSRGQPCPRLILIRQTGVWPSSEQTLLYDLLCRTHDAVGNIDSAPGHLFDPSESEESIALLVLGLAFGWDGSVYAASQTGAVHFDHDGCVWTAGTSQDPEPLRL